MSGNSGNKLLALLPLWPGHWALGAAERWQKGVLLRVCDGTGQRDIVMRAPVSACAYMCGHESRCGFIQTDFSPFLGLGWEAQNLHSQHPLPLTSLYVRKVKTSLSSARDTRNIHLLWPGRTLWSLLPLSTFQIWVPPFYWLTDNCCLDSLPTGSLLHFWSLFLKLQKVS